MSEMPLHIIAVGALVMRDDHVLLVKSPRRGWELPGGQVECGEDLIQGLQREIYEESGIHIADPVLVGLYSNISTTPTRLMIDYIAQYAGGELHTSEESIEVGWFTPEEAQKMITHSTYQYRLEKILTLKGSTYHASYRTQPVFEIVHEYEI